MKSKTFGQEVFEKNRIFILVGLLVALVLTAMFLVNVSKASAAGGNFGPECSGCHEIDDPGDPGGGACGSCHGTTPATMSQGSHPTHFNSTGRGPGIANCSTCHGPGTDDSNPAYFTNPLHRNGVVNFNGTPGEVLSNTTACNGCHSPGGIYNGVNSISGSIGAKDNWTDGVYTPPFTGGQLDPTKAKWCVSCHDDAPPTIGTQTAKNIAGDDSTYGYYKSGHGLDSGSKYDKDAIDDATGTAGANKKCTDCHDAAKDHINDADDTSVDGQRIQSTINGLPVSAVGDACKDCHSVTTGTPASVKVSAHGNETSTGGFNAPAEAPFAKECQNCHNPHSNQLNAASTRNLKMIRPDVAIATGVAGDVVFKNTTGADSFDELDTEPTDTGTPQQIDWANNKDDICTTCHSSSSNPGYPTVNHAGGYGHQGGGDNRGLNCTTCHNHNRGGDAVYQYNDGFMPSGGACGSCHDALTSTMKNGSHETHFKFNESGDPQSLKGPGIALCDSCHGLGASSGSHAGHMNGIKNFIEGPTVTLTATGACDTCHSPGGGYNGVALAKPNWNYPTTTFPGPVEPPVNVGNHGIYDTTATIRAGEPKTWCVGCHDSLPSQILVGETTSTSGTLMTAPEVGGDGTGYGAFVNGHSTTATAYDESALNDTGGNGAANKWCSKCHDLTTLHLNQTQDTDLAGQRIAGEINTVTISSISDVCKACHQKTTGADSAANQASSHGNSGESYVKIEPATMTEIECTRCHEGHGNNKNANTNRNLKMIRASVDVTTGVPAGVVYENRTNARSLDGTATAATSLCRACHANANNPGYTMLRHEGGNHATSDTASIFEGAPPADSDKRNQDCTACHEHNYKGNVSPSSNANGFMPAFIQTNWPTQLSCDGACHKTTNSTMVANSHATHLSAASLIGPQIGLCDTCHGVGAISGTQEGHFVDGWANFP